MKRTKTIIAVGLLVCLISTAFAGFTGTIKFTGSVSTADVGFEIVKYSGTWVYKDLETGDKILSRTPLEGDEYLEVSKCWAEAGEGQWDVKMTYDNLYPCNYMICDFIAHYVGSIPVHVVGMSFESSLWLEDYISYNFYSCTKEGDEFIIGPQVDEGYQLHLCMYLYVEVIVKLPQDDNLQGKTAWFHGQLDVIQWDEYCMKVLSLPPGKVTMQAAYPGVQGGSYFDITLSNVPAGYDVTDGTYLGWCVDQSTNMQYTPTSVDLICSYDPRLDTIYPDPDWDMVNYLINHKHTSASKGDIQAAIWYFIDGGVLPEEGTYAREMVDDALNNGEGFKPQSGEWCAVFVLNDWQKIFIEVDP